MGHDAVSIVLRSSKQMMVHPMYKVGDKLDLAGDLLDTNHPLEEVEPLLNGGGV